MINFLKRCFDYYLKRNVYYQENKFIYNVKNRVCFNIDENKYMNEYFKIYFIDLPDYDRRQISKEEYNKINKNIFCDCPVGSGIPDIKKGEKYDLVKEFNKYNINEDLHIDINMHIDKTDLIVKSKKNSLSWVLNEKIYYKKACLKCNKCLSDYYIMINYFNKIIKYFEDHDKVNEVCKDN